MNDFIDINDISTYPMEFKKFCNDQIDILKNTITEEFSLDHDTFLARKLFDILKQYKIIGIHATRVYDIENIYKKGLLIPSKSKDLIDIILNPICTKINKEEFANIRKKLIHKISIDDKYSRLHFVVGSIDDITIENGLLMLNKYGGELLEVYFNDVINMIETRRYNAYKKVNEELISLYWDFVKYISEKVNDNNWGDKIVEKLAEFMKREYPTMRGFNKRGIYRMKQFYETYKDYPFVSPLVTQISWTNNLIILSSTNSIEEKEFYIKMCIKNNYSKRELDRQIGSGYYQRYMLSNGKANESLAKVEGDEDYPNTRILDTYCLEFLDLPNQYSEKDLKKAIISNMKDFILEKILPMLGKNIEYKLGMKIFI